MPKTELECRNCEWVDICDQSENGCCDTDCICPVSGKPCPDKRKTCEPDWGGHGESPYCWLK